MKLEQHDLDFMKLLLRSPAYGEGWRHVAPGLIKLCEIAVGRRPELYEFDTTSNPSRIRLTERGSILADYV